MERIASLQKSENYHITTQITKIFASMVEIYAR